MGIDAAVCIPWRPQPDRIAAFKRVVSFWEHFGYPISVSDSDPGEPFNLSAARNNAVLKANAELIVLTDADVILDIGNVAAALADPVGVTYLFTTYLHIPGEYVDRADLMTAPAVNTYRNSCSPMLVCSAETYWNVGGFDEKFTGWGYEDNAFHAAASTLSTVRRMPGRVFSFDHGGTRDTSRNNPNKPRYSLYQFANGKPDVMYELIR